MIKLHTHYKIIYQFVNKLFLLEIKLKNKLFKKNVNELMSQIFNTYRIAQSILQSTSSTR